MNLIYNHQCDTLRWLNDLLEHTPVIVEEEKRTRIKTAIEAQHREMDAYLAAVMNEACLSNPIVDYKTTMREFISCHNGDEFCLTDLLDYVFLFHPTLSKAKVQMALHNMIGKEVNRNGWNRYSAIHEHDSSK